MKIYGLGSNGSGQLGIGHLEDVSTPTPLVIPNTVRNDEPTQIAAGGNHTLILFQSGALYSMGSNEDGRAALQPSTKQTSALLPAKVARSPVKVHACAATWSASFFATDDGSILSCGSGSAGELGLGPGRVTAALPEVIAVPDAARGAAIQLEASMSHVIAVLSGGQVIGWGNGRNGQLGEPVETVWSPRVLSVPFAVARAACGKEFTLLLSSDHDAEVMLLGPNKRDRFSIRDTVPRSFGSWKQVVASWGSIFHLNEGALTGYGRNDRGQLGSEDLPTLKTVTAGSEHVLAQTEQGHALVWGGGEHGNCGLPGDTNKDVKNRFNTLDIPGRVTLIGAGCATSFIVTDAD